jgi:Cys-rich protein (TIGR01571 family)
VRERAVGDDVPVDVARVLSQRCRQALKQALGLQDGSGCCGDGVKFIFCAPCMICQELNELDRQRHNQSLGDTSIMPQSMV